MQQDVELYSNWMQGARMQSALKVSSTVAQHLHMCEAKYKHFRLHSSIHEKQH